MRRSEWVFVVFLGLLTVAAAVGFGTLAFQLPIGDRSATYRDLETDVPKANVPSRYEKAEEFVVAGASYVFEDAADPTVNDDRNGTAGNGIFYKLDRWHNTDSDQFWECIDGNPGAAEWRRIGLSMTLINVERQHPPSPPPVHLVAGMQDNETWAKTSGNVVVTLDENAANVRIGHQSLKMVMPGGDISTVDMTSGLQPAVDIRGNIGIWLKIDDVSECLDFRVQLQATLADTAKMHVWIGIVDVGNDFNLQDGEWKLCWLTRTAATEGGSPEAWDKDNPLKHVDGIRLRIQSDAGGCTVWVGGIVSQNWPKSYFIFTFDDQYESLYDVVLPAFNARGWKFTSFVLGSEVGGAGRCTEAQLQEIYDSGHDLASHRWTHEAWTNATLVATVYDQLARSVAYARDKGWYRGADFIAWPHNAGYSVGEDTAAVAELFFKGARTATSRDGKPYPGGLLANLDKYGWAPITFDRYNIKALPLYDATVSWANFQSYVDEVEADRHVLMVYTHEVIASPGASDISIDRFNAIMGLFDQKVAAGTWEVLSLSQWSDMIYHNSNWDYSVDGYGALIDVY